MTTAILNTLDIVKKAKKAGYTETQAELIADIVDSQVATKSDLKELESKIDVKIAEAKTELSRWLLGILLSQVGLIITILIKFHN